MPARLPNLLLNGTSGIAVGMATDIPPHNLREVANACIHAAGRARHQQPARLMKHSSRVPDLPTGAEIVSPRADLLEFYEKGNGQLSRPRHLGNRRGNRQRRDHHAAAPGLGQQAAGTDRAADPRQETADGRRHPRRVGPREPGAHRDRAALEPRRPAAADGAPVRHHRPGAQLPGQPERHRPRRPAEGDGAEGAADASGSSSASAP